MMGLGPVVLGECSYAAELLKAKGIDAGIWNNSWMSI